MTQTSTSRPPPLSDLYRPATSSHSPHLPPPSWLINAEKNHGVGRKYFLTRYTFLYTYIYIYSAFPSISYEFLINPSFRGHRFEDRFEFLPPPFFRYVVVSRIASRERKTNGDIKEPIDRQSSNSGTKESAADKGERRW